MGSKIVKETNWKQEVARSLVMNWEILLGWYTILKKHRLLTVELQNGLAIHEQTEQEKIGVQNPGNQSFCKRRLE